MGSGRWSSKTYAAAATARTLTGASAFAYTDSTLRSLPRNKWKAHETLDPHDVGLREARDSDEHPTTLGIAVIFDVTGSMSRIPRQLQQELPKLLDHILQNGYVEHPQILFGAVGDATCDRIPLQVAQFESDNRMDEQLGLIALEGGGGGQKTESYELALYFMARNTSLDCIEKRNDKGFLFMIGDELPYPKVKAKEVVDVIGDGIQEDIDFEDILNEVKTKFEFYFILPRNAAHGTDQEVVSFWKERLGDHFLHVDNMDDVCDTIGMTVATRRAVADLNAVVAP